MRSHCVWRLNPPSRRCAQRQRRGRLIGTEFEPSKAVHAREDLAAAGLSDLVEIREGDALETLAHDMPDTIDLVLLDGAKPLYPGILSPICCPDYLARIRSAAGGRLSYSLRPT
jgi:hypothetical protein